MKLLHQQYGMLTTQYFTVSLYLSGCVCVPLPCTIAVIGELLAAGKVAMEMTVNCAGFPPEIL